MKIYSTQQYVELFHILFINQLGRKVDKQLYAIKGGCNMRFYFESFRYSEDIDFDVKTIAKETLIKHVNSILNSTPFKNILKTNNLEISSTSTLKQTSTTQRWKISLQLNDSAMPINTKIEFSRRNFNKDISYEAIKPSILKQYSLTPIMASHYGHQQMYEQKVLALALRSQVQSRDIFDLYFLLGLGLILKPLTPQVKENIPLAIANAAGVSFSDFKGQVIAYLDKSYQTEYDDESTWKKIISNVVSALEKQKIMKLIDAYTDLLKLNIPVLQTRDVAALFRISLNHANKLLTRLAVNKLILRIKQGTWVFPNIEAWVIPSFLAAPFPLYLSLQTALYYHGMISQIPNIVYGISLARSRSYQTPIVNVSIHHVQDSFFFGFNQVENNQYVQMATPEKALIDIFYLSPVKTQLFRALPEVDLPKNFKVTVANKMISRITSSGKRTLVRELFNEFIDTGYYSLR